MSALELHSNKKAADKKYSFLAALAAHLTRKNPSAAAEKLVELHQMLQYAAPEALALIDKELACASAAL